MPERRRENPNTKRKVALLEQLIDSFIVGSPIFGFGFV